MSTDPNDPNWGKDGPPDIGVEEATGYWKSLGVQDGVVRCFADPYEPFTPDQVAAIIAPTWKNAINTLGLKTTVNFDCDDYADGARWYAHVRRMKDEAELPPAFFYIAYAKEDVGEHAVCGCMWRNPDRSLMVAFFEPQPTVTMGGFAEEVLKLVTLAPAEISSATDIRY